MIPKVNPKDESDRIAEKAFFVNLLEPANVPFFPDYANELKKERVGLENITTVHPWSDTKECFSRFCEWLDIFEKNQNALLQIRSVRDIEKARTEGKTGIILGSQGAAGMLGDNLRYLRGFYNLGLRVMGVSYQSRSYFGDGCAEPKDGGLSQLGEKLIAEANELGILVDLSHTGRTASMETIQVSKDPVIFSHSNAKALCNHRRNLDDDQMKAVAEKGGMIGICAYSVILAEGRKATLNDFWDHLDYIEKQVGVDHIGVGLDAHPEFGSNVAALKEALAEFNRRHPEIGGKYKFATHPEGLTGPFEWRNIIPGLLERGYSEDDIIKILGGNALRIFERVWKT